MESCIIFCAGDFDGLIAPVEKEDYLLAADGGLAHLQHLGLRADGILGDFDSLGYVPQNALCYPIEKDDTDSMLAVRKGLSLGFHRFVLYGSLDGPRLDHTIANLQTLQFLAQQHAVGYLVGTTHLVTLVRNGTIRFPATAEGILSVFCLGADAQGVTLSGLKYPMDNGILTSGFPLGVSNHFTGVPAEITVESGSLLVIYDRKNGFPDVHNMEGQCYGF